MNLPVRHLSSKNSYPTSSTVPSMKNEWKNRILLTFQTTSDGRALWRAHQAPRRAPAPSLLSIGLFFKMDAQTYLYFQFAWLAQVSMTNLIKPVWIFLISHQPRFVTKKRQLRYISSQKKSLLNRAKKYSFQLNFYELQITCNERTKACSKRQKKVFCDFNY